MYLMNIKAKIFKILSNKIQQHIKWVIQVEFIPGNIWFNIKKSIIVTHHINKKQKTFDDLNRQRRNILKNVYLFIDLKKSLNTVGIKGISLS